MSALIPARGCDRPALKLLNKYVIKDATVKWHDLGLELLEQKDEEELNQIQIDNPKDGNKCCKEMFQLWLRKCPNATWNQLIKALEEPSIELNKLASTIKEMLKPMEDTVSPSTGDAVKDESKTFESQPTNKNMINIQITRGVCIISATLLCCFCLLVTLLTVISIILALMKVSGRMDVPITINVWLPGIQIGSISLITENTYVLKDTKVNYKSGKKMENGRVSKNVTAVDVDQRVHDETLAPLILMVSNFTKKMKNRERWHSDPFIAYKGGHKICLRVDAGGRDKDYGTHVSVFLQLMKDQSYNGVNQSGHLAVNGYLVIELISQVMIIPHNLRILTLNNHSCSTCINKVNNNIEATWFGFTDFVSMESVHAYYLKDDSLHFRVTYSEYFWYIDAMLLYIPNIPAVLLSAVVSSIVIYLILISVEFVAFCTEESNALTPSCSDFSIGSIKRFLLTKQNVLLSTWYVTMYSTVWEFITYTLTVVIEVIFIAAGELVLWDNTTTSDNILSTIMTVQRISIVIVFSMIINQYMMSWGGNIIMVHPLWLIKAYSYSMAKY